MFHKSHLLNKQLVVATALALGASGIALADDSSMNPFIGDSYKYFNGSRNLEIRGLSIGRSTAPHPRIHPGARATPMA